MSSLSKTKKSYLEITTVKSLKESFLKSHFVIAQW